MTISFDITFCSEGDLCSTKGTSFKLFEKDSWTNQYGSGSFFVINMGVLRLVLEVFTPMKLRKSTKNG